MSNRISILMSVFKETEFQIRQSVESMLGQTYRNFELIIVNDNPDCDEIKGILDSYSDSRIKFSQNDVNLGLALSMNKAARLASPDVEIFVRMDADDIAVNTRLEKSLIYLTSGKYDCVFSQYHYIDENSKNLASPLQPIIPDDKLSKVIALHPVIHHPTVAFTKRIFEKVGGYRDFPCSQDLDLWLRMCEAGCRFHMIDEPLLYYRLNPDSVSSKKWFRQQLTCNYIFELSIQRIKTGKDSYSKEHYEEYLNNKGLGNPKVEKNLRNSYQDLSRAIKYRREGNRFKAIFLRLKAFLESDIKRDAYWKFLKKKIMTYYIKKQYEFPK